ncbi:MAG TPA: N-acetyl-gamma-glutamyl-phosphate reductase [Acidiferrobacteraceae bacterium]|nr:N-acetyl-gamma-glutamyl-phosphate reductase [Acidiferrobacteraceae bacterium]
MNERVKVGIIGGTGYSGAELLRLLVTHPRVDIAVITSRGEAGKRVASMFPHLEGFLDLVFTAPDPAALSACDIVFSATPNGVAMTQAPALLDAGVRVIDFAADFRLRDPALWEQWYKMPHACPEILKEAVYGLPETHRADIAKARLIANPGCYPTAVQLGFLPLLEADLVDRKGLIADCKSGVSGAGRAAHVHTLFGEASDTLKAYAVSGHRHLPEIEQELSWAVDAPLALTFVPHLTPMIRGIHATLYAPLKDPDVDLQSLFERRYAHEAFVRVLPQGSHPETRSVRGSNVCQIAVHQAPHAPLAIVLAVIDNLTKGAAGQAVQNMNILCGWPETLGLAAPGLLP